VCLVRGKIVSMGEGSVIEAGAVIHHSCRLILGARTVVGACAVLWDQLDPDELVASRCWLVNAFNAR
jgi:carbonic anhydrase/acetyltransferase-like protein (isoleucine patch superfamily)